MPGNETTQLTPTFIGYLNGTRFSGDMESDVKEIIVENRIDGASSFAITMSDMGRKWTDSKDFADGARVKLMLGYKDAVKDVFEGVITGVSPIFRKNADERVIIRGHDIMHKLHRAQKTQSFSKMTDKEIVNKIASGAGISADVDNLSTSHIFTMQRNQTDYEYLRLMALRCNCRMMVKDGKLAFKPVKDISSDEVIVEWGKTLIEFLPDLDTSRLITGVEVRGWDNAKASAITGTAACSDITKKIGGDSPGGSLVSDNYGEMSTIYIDDNIADKNSAEKAALNILTSNSMSYINATAKVQGNNKIVPGMVVRMKELGDKFSGEYFLTEVVHHFVAEQGYTTRFKCQRNAM